MQIVVLGMHRSGTSMATRLLNMLGAYVGPERMMLEYGSKKMDASNARGHWERQDVLSLNDAILAEHQANWLTPVTEEALSDETISDAQKDAIRLCLYGMDAHRPWVMKDPRLCLTLPCWAAHMEVPLVVFVTRNPGEIALSLEKRNGIPIAKGIAMWEYYIASALNASLEIPRLFVDYEHLLQRPQTSLEGILGWLRSEGAKRLEMPSDKEIRAFIDPNLYCAKSADSHIPFTNNNQQQLWQILQGKIPQLGYMTCSDKSKQLLASK